MDTLKISSLLFLLAGCAALSEMSPAEEEAASEPSTPVRESGRADAADEAALPAAPDEAALPAAPDEAALLAAPEGGAPAPSRVDPSRVAPSRVAPKRRRPPAPPASPGVKAGAADDNLQFNAFSSFVRENAQLGLTQITDDRVELRVRDRDGRPLPLAEVRVAGRLRRRTHADGRALLHPRRWGVSERAEVRVRAGGAEARVSLAAARARKLDVTLDVARQVEEQVPLDVAFVIDTTGSMGDELKKLRQTLDTIVFQVGALRPRPRLRLGMVLYRDQGDAYVTRVVPFTSDVGRFERALARVAPGGGGDTPEDVQSGLRDAMRELDWSGEGLQLAFLIGDAAPHLDYGQTYTYLDAANEAATRGIKITTIGASGLDRRGELVWRQIAQATSAPFVFLTYGETGDSEGSASTVSHHVGSNWVAADLDAIIVRMVKRELLHFRDRPVAERDDFFSAAPDPRRPAEDVLEELFARSMKQLVDYAVEPLGRRVPTVVLPLRLEGVVAEARARLERRLTLGIARTSPFRLVETEMQAELLEQIARQLAASYGEGDKPAPGKLLPAELAVLGKLHPGKAGELDLLIELVKLETGEVLSLSLLEIDERLLL